QGLRRQRPVGVGVGQRLTAAGAGEEEDLADRRLGNVSLAYPPRRTAGVSGTEGLLRLGGGAEGDRAEDVGVGAVIDLGPAVERVLVALGAFEADAEERGGRLLAPLVNGHALLAAPEQVEGGPVGVHVVEARAGGLGLLDLLDVLLRRVSLAAGGAEDAVD